MAFLSKLAGKGRGSRRFPRNLGEWKFLLGTNQEEKT